MSIRNFMLVLQDTLSLKLQKPELYAAIDPEKKKATFTFLPKTAPDKRNNSLTRKGKEKALIS
ncbi:MAG: hypothetical protein KKA59_03670 [Candidatus Omnitrophica bacterium]|nr:hypothetical protein [Candidatus Omnitrophota bacterium]